MFAGRLVSLLKPRSRVASAERSRNMPAGRAAREFMLRVRMDSWESPANIPSGKETSLFSYSPRVWRDERPAKTPAGRDDSSFPWRYTADRPAGGCGEKAVKFQGIDVKARFEQSYVEIVHEHVAKQGEQSERRIRIARSRTERIACKAAMTSRATKEHKLAQTHGDAQ